MATDARRTFRRSVGMFAVAAALAGAAPSQAQEADPLAAMIRAVETAAPIALARRRAPGAAYHYASSGYSLLELTVEEITGDGFADYMEWEILAALGMADSAFHWTDALRARAAVGHVWFGNPLPLYRHPTKAQGDLVATAGDMTRFVAATMPGPRNDDAHPVGRVLDPPVADGDDAMTDGSSPRGTQTSGIHLPRQGKLPRPRPAEPLRHRVPQES